MTTAVTQWLGLWCMEPRVAGSNPAGHVDLFFFPLSRKFFGSLVVPVLLKQISGTHAGTVETAFDIICKALIAFLYHIWKSVPPDVKY